MEELTDILDKFLVRLTQAQFLGLAVECVQTLFYGYWVKRLVCAALGCRLTAWVGCFSW
jgi:hypothetical protein